MIRLEPTPRTFAFRETWTKWSALIVVLYIGLLAAATAVSFLTPLEVETCTFRRLTDRPCGGCGSTRLLIKLIQGRPLQAFLLNPFMCVATLLGINLLLLKIVFQRRVDFRPSNALRLSLYAVLVVAFIVNWWYVLTFVG